MNRNVRHALDDAKTWKGFRKIAIAGAAVISSAAASGTGISNISLGPQVAGALEDGYQLGKLLRASGAPEPNPLWLMNDPNEKDRLVTFQSFDPHKASPRTISYLQHRRMKNWGSTAVGLGGMFSSAHTAGVNLPSAGKEANAVGVTQKHIGVIERIGVDNARSRTVREWVDQILLLKNYKLNIRSTKFVGAVVPHASVVTSIAAEFMQLGVDMYFGLICEELAMEIHYTAFVEMIYKNGEGPASDIVRELFTRRGAMWVLGKYDPNEYIREPGGWKAIADKIAMI